MSAGVPVQHKFEVLINSTVSQTEHKFEVRQTEQAMDGLGSSRRGLWCVGRQGCAPGGLGRWRMRHHTHMLALPSLPEAYLPQPTYPLATINVAGVGRGPLIKA